MEHEALSLCQLNALVRRTVEAGMPEAYWVQAEISELRVNGGHCYLEFVQKEERRDTIVAKARGVIWRSLFAVLRPYFEQATGQSLAPGIKVLVEVRVSFHEVYGFSLTVTDIDPSYTVGDLALRRREILARVEAEGVLGMNRELPFPMLPQRVAVIASATSAGYGDFCDQLAANSRGYYFRVTLFPAVMQGAELEPSVLRALDSINAQADDFDVVVIIRGGGATSDLRGFDTYALASACAQFPLPVITGIGHQRDDTVLDSVAYQRVKTPTAAAEYLIAAMDRAADRLAELASRLMQAVPRALSRSRDRLLLLQGRVGSAAGSRLSAETLRLQSLRHRCDMGVAALLSDRRHRLQMIEQHLADASPSRILARGYSITLCGGRVVKDAQALKAGDELLTVLSGGSLKSAVTETLENNDLKYGNREE